MPETRVETVAIESNSIEILGQKLSYPTTWKGVWSVGLVGGTICFVAWTFDPLKIKELKELIEVLKSEKSVLKSENQDLAVKINTTEEELTLVKNDAEQKDKEIKSKARTLEIAAKAVAASTYEIKQYDDFLATVGSSKDKLPAEIVDKWGGYKPLIEKSSLDRKIVTNQFIEAMIGEKGVQPIKPDLFKPDEPIINYPYWFQNQNTPKLTPEEWLIENYSPKGLDVPRSEDK